MPLDIYPADFEERIREYLGSMSMGPGLQPAVYVNLERDKLIPNGRWYLQTIAPSRYDVDTRINTRGMGGKIYLSPFTIESEVVQTGFGSIKSYYEHEVREHFRYKGKRVFGPHIDINAYLEIADRITSRPRIADGQA